MFAAAQYLVLIRYIGLNWHSAMTWYVECTDHSNSSRSRLESCACVFSE